MKIAKISWKIGERKTNKGLRAKAAFIKDKVKFEWRNNDSLYEADRFLWETLYHLNTIPKYIVECLLEARRELFILEIVLIEKNRRVIG